MFEKIRSISPTELYGGQGRKYVEAPILNYLVVQKRGIKYQKVGLNTNLI